MPSSDLLLENCKSPFCNLSGDATWEGHFQHSFCSGPTHCICKEFKVCCEFKFCRARRDQVAGNVKSSCCCYCTKFHPPLTWTVLRVESEAVQACSSSLKLTGILKIKIMKLMEVQGLDNRSLDLVVWLKVLKQLSRLRWSARDILLFPCTTAWASADLMAGQGNAPAATQAFPLIAHGNLISCFLVYRITRLSYSWVWEQEDSANKDIFIAGLTPVVLGEG